MCVELLLSHLTTAKPLTKLVTGGGFFSTGVCPCSVALASPLVCCVSFFLFSSSIFLNISMKLPSLANTFPPGIVAGLLEGDAGLPQLESPLPPLVWGLPCARFESMFPGCDADKQAKSSASKRICARLLNSMALLRSWPLMWSASRHAARRRGPHPQHNIKSPEFN